MGKHYDLGKTRLGLGKCQDRRIGVKEIERHIKKLKTDKEILAEADVKPSLEGGKAPRFPNPPATERVQRFKEAVRELGCDESEGRFDSVLRAVAKHKPSATKARRNRGAHAGRCRKRALSTTSARLRTA